MTSEVEEQQKLGSAAGSEGATEGGEGARPPPKVLHLPAAERSDRGRAARAEAPRTSHASLDLVPGRDPVALIDADTPQRVQELVPIRYGRMLVSPFTFYRGAAAIMAPALAATPRSSLNVPLGGDAHLSTFGGFASPERSLVFDLNDFDETHQGPFEWDVKRLAASFEIAGRNREFADAERRAAVLAGGRAYPGGRRRFAGRGDPEVLYARPGGGRLEAAPRDPEARKGRT